MGKNTAKAQRDLADKARERKNAHARKGEMLDAMDEQHVETDYRRRADQSERNPRTW
jgi:hypothetical protein